MSNAPQNKPNANRPTKRPRAALVGSYLFYGLILVGIVVLWLTPNRKSNVQKAAWDKVEYVLLKGDQERVVVVNKEYAEIVLKRSAVKRDTAYADFRVPDRLGRPESMQNPTYRYDFVTFENFEKDLQSVESQIVARDTVGLTDPEQIRQTVRNARIDLQPETRTNAWHEMLVLFGPLLMLILFFVFMSRMTQRQMGGGSSGGIFNVGKSKAKVYDGKTATNVTFKDVAGLAGAKEEVMEVVDFLKNPRKYTALGGKIPKGVLLVGPPGTGKTLLAKAVAGEANVPFFSMSGSDFVEMFVGVGASRVRDLFEEAKKKSPCIIFIDEIDAVGRARGHSGLSNANDERENTLNQLLTEMDGFTTNLGVIVLAATNRADVLDKALLRAGRFDRQIYVELPDVEERKAIFAVHMQNLRLGTDIDKDFLAKQTPGFSGADIANVCNEAALVAARKSKKTIEKQDFLDAIDRIVGGLEKRTKVLSDQEKRTIAYHESGHASVSWLSRWGDPLVKVTIVPRGKALGAAWYLPEERQITTYEQMFDSITSLMAGRAAEEIVFGKISTGALNDIERATKMAFAMVSYYGMSPRVGNVSFYDSTGQSDWNFTKPFSEETNQLIDSEVKRIVEEAYQRAKQLIVEHRAQLDELASTLYEREVIFKDDVERIYGPRPWDEKNESATEEKLAQDASTDAAAALTEGAATAEEEPVTVPPSEIEAPPEPEAAVENDKTT
ncbi:MAG: ATP-dependent zinc metalloprotease FtsH [Bacteroidales bacterium]|nr:ATP-dependent zinc metalloprotease FtsH [Bacteroidales bacterium]